MELVSVLIPAYNHEKYVQETIKSIIAQTYDNIELIIIDDGSTDSTWQKIQEMKPECEKRFTDIYFETKQNEGTCLTLNKLLSHANGKYVYIIASDDLAKPDAIKKEAEFLDKNQEYALAVGNNEFIDYDGKRCYWDKNKNTVYSKKNAKYITFADFLEKIKPIKFKSKDFGTYKTLNTGNYIPNGYMIRKSIFDKTGYFTPKAPLEDFYLMLQISKYAKMKYIDEILFSYRWHDSNTVKNNDKIKQYTEKTMEYEDSILKNINENSVSKEVIEVKKNGACYKKRGIPFLFQILTFRKRNKKKIKKIKKLKIFNIKIAEWEKKPHIPSKINYENSFASSTNPTNVVIFAMYDKDGLIPQNVIDYISELKKYNDYIILVADNKIKPAEIDKLKNLTNYCCFKRHKEYDFGSYKRGFEFLKKQSFFKNVKNLTFCNDSVLYQGASLEQYFINQKQYPFYGLTCNMYSFKLGYKRYIPTKEPHIQSFFFSLKAEIFKENWFEKFIKSIKKQRNKKSLIIKYEVGLSKLIIKHGYEIHSFYPPNEYVVDPCGYYLNLESPYNQKRIFIKKNSQYSYIKIDPESVNSIGEDSFKQKLFLLLQKLFSVHNISSGGITYKVIYILGISISLKLNKK